MNELKLVDDYNEDFLFSVPIDERYISSQEKENNNNSYILNGSFSESNSEFMEKFMVSDNKSKDNSFLILNDLKLNKSYSAIVNLNQKYNSSANPNSSIKKQSSDINNEIAFNMMNKNFKEISSFDIIDNKVLDDLQPYLNSTSFNYLNEDSFINKNNTSKIISEAIYDIEKSSIKNTQMIRDLVIAENIEEVRSGVLNKLLMMDLIYTPLNNRSPINTNFKQHFSITNKLNIDNTKVIIKNITNNEIQEKIIKDNNKRILPLNTKNKEVDLNQIKKEKTENKLEKNNKNISINKIVDTSKIKSKTNLNNLDSKKPVKRDETNHTKKS